MASEKDIAPTPMVADEPNDFEKGTVIDKRADLGLQFLEKTGAVEYTEEEEQRVRWKIDLYLMPILMLTFGLQYLDKVTVSYAAVYNMNRDLNLVGQQYSWANSVFYFGYLVGEFPANYLIQKLPIGKFSGVCILLWGAMVMLCAAAKNFAGLATLRFLMGFFEAGIPPCWIYITSMFYKASEQGMRACAWYFMVGVAAIVGGLLGYGVGHIRTGVTQWQFVFLICGGFTVFWAFVVGFYLPDSPLNAKFLTEREKAIAIDRLRSNRTGVKSSEFKAKQALEALHDPQVWLFALWSGTSQILNIGGSFLPLIIQDMGFTGLQTTLLTLPVGGVECVAMVVAGSLSSYLANGRTGIMFCVACPTLVGAVLLQTLPLTSVWGRATGVWLFLCIPASYAIMLSLISSNIAGTTKKVTTTLLSFVLFCVGNIVSPQLFRASEAPQYGTAMRSMLVAMALVQLITILLGTYYIYENRRRDKVLASTPQEVIDAATARNEEFFDRTDIEDSLRFRYRW
ncbi:putative transporter [Neonectria ditissima]|uniref:Putative transporter n=1 Tax=Neonectria ditissima TaxID=78410 RepID=A0A0P7BRF3_9HYPO|nr:putative transporter [Neonectria ditissima]